MKTFTAVTDETVAQTIDASRSRLVLVTPGLSEVVAKAVDQLAATRGEAQVALILDPDEDAYRVGYGDRKGAELLKTLVQRPNVTVRSQPGLRIGVLIADARILVWSPTPKAVESNRTPEEPNGIQLDSGGNVTEQLQHAVGSDAPNTVLADADIGRKTLDAEQVAKTVEVLAANPPAPVDLSKMARVFSTKIQFVECTLRGAQWTEREIKVSNLLLNADVPEDLKELFDTKIRPYSKQADVPIQVQAMVQGQLAFDKGGKPLTNPRTQAQIKQEWDDIQKRYLGRMRGFGLLIRRADKPAFEAEVGSFEVVLKSWVEGFRKVVQNEEEDLVRRVSTVVMARLASMRAPDRPLFDPNKITSVIRDGIQGMRIVKPTVKLVFKDISWESTGDPEFRRALAEVLPSEDLRGWFSVYAAAPQRKDPDLFKRDVLPGLA